MAVTLLVTSGCTLATVRSLDEDAEAKEGFSAEDYIDGIWESEFIPTLNENAIETSELLQAIDQDEDEAIDEYGSRAGTGNYSFMVKGEARVLSVNRESRVGLAPMDLPPFDGEADVFLAIGPVLRGNALRDAVGFIEFNDFTNQVEFAQVSNALTDRVKDDVLASVDIDALVGETIEYVGAFTLEERDEIVIMPVSIEVADQ
jgi:predicted lipoprotein